MESAGDDVEFAGDAAVTEPARVLDVLVVEEVEGADADPGRGKTGEILAAGGGRVRGDVGDDQPYRLLLGVQTRTLRVSRSVLVVVRSSSMGWGTAAAGQSRSDFW
ncbi:hypothetical protein ASD08_24730 [Streptomyces sp. Root369]|nr:hypothetical protein ASD08_24730 [Streptomyces sp. Root369]